MSQCPVAIADDDNREYGMLMGLGGMCFLELDLFKKTGNSGPYGLFSDVFTTPAVVAACVDNNFQDLLNPACYDTEGRGRARHKQYSCLERMVTSTSRDLLHAWNSDLFRQAWNLAAPRVPAMLHHLRRAGGLEQKLPTLHKRAVRTRRYLRKYSWKVMVWAGAIPYSYLEWSTEAKPKLLQLLMGVLVAEVEELHNSLVRYGCDNFVLIGVLIVHGAPRAGPPRVRHQSVRVSTSRTQRSEAYITFFESQLNGAHFVHTDSPALVAMERNRVMQFVAPYMTWELFPDWTRNRSFLYNPYMELSVWGAPLQLDDQADQAAADAVDAPLPNRSFLYNPTADQAAAQAVRGCPVLSSGVPPWYEYQLQMQSMQSTKDMLETAPVIVSDSTLLHWSVFCKLVTLGMDKGYIIGGYGKILLQLPENMIDDILAGAVRHARDKVDGRVRVGYIPLQQCGRDGYSEYGRAQADKFDALAALGYDLVAMPTIEDFAQMYINEQNDDRFFPSKGAHYTPARQKWLSVALVLWAKAHSLSMVLCLGWNSPSLQVLNAELEAQKRLVVELEFRATQRYLAIDL